MLRHLGTAIVLLVVLCGAGAVAWLGIQRANTTTLEEGGPEQGAVAVEVAPVESGTIRELRQLSATLEAPARFVVAAKVAGLLERVIADIGDSVERGQVVAEIDDAEFIQDVAQARAELGVRRAELARAQTELELARRDFERAQALKERGIAPEAQLDETAAAQESAEASVALAEAQVQRAEAALELARIRLGYTDVRAEWGGGLDSGVVGERFQDAGNTVQVGDPIVSVVTIDPLRAVVSVTERDYPRLEVGQPATLMTDALPGRAFDAEISRIAPVFRESSRQARVELLVENPQTLLRPGMFARVRVVLHEEEAGTIIPLAAVAQREGRDVVFVLDGDRVVQRPVELGIVEGERVQVLSEGVEGRVVVLGQQLLEDGSAVRVYEGSVASLDSEGGG